MAATMRIPTEFVAVDRFSRVVRSMTDGVSNFTRTTEASVQRFNKKLNSAANSSAIAATAITGVLGLAAKSAIDFEDKMADVAKTTGLSGKPLEDYGKAILDTSKTTRSSIDDLLAIGEIGGQLGVAKEELIAFTQASNKFAVALGEDYGGTEQAITQVGKINKLFKDTRNLDISSSITKTGSAINELGAVGAGTSANINDFVLRMGALPDALKASFSQTAALGTFFEEVGIDAQIAAGGMSNFLLVAGKNMGGFAKQIGISTQEAKKLFAEDPTQFATLFSKSLSKLSPDKLAKKLEKLKLGSQETIKVIGALGVGHVRLGELIGVANKAFEEGTSLNFEYAKKNDTMAAKIKIAQNNFEVMSITIGTKLLPVLGGIIDKIVPVISKFTEFADNNPWLIKTVLGITAALWLFFAVAKVITTATTLWTAAQWLLNVAMTANPVGVIIMAIAALIALVVLVIAKWDEWGAALSLFMGPLGWIISLIQSFRRNWDMVVKAFTTDGILGGLKAIGIVILDAILMPVQQLLELLAKIPGLGDLAGNGAKKILEIRNSLGVSTEPVKKQQDVKMLDSPEQMNATAIKENRLNGNIDINVRDKGSNVDNVDYAGFSGIPVKLTPTQGAFGN